MPTLPSRGTKNILLAVGLVVVHASYLISTAQRLWSQEHYQFFPVVLATVAILIWYRLEGFQWEHKPRLTIRNGLYGLISLSLYAGAFLLRSDWIGTLSTLAFLWTMVWFAGGRKLASLLRGPIFLLLLIVPLPMGLDLRLIIELQRTATSIASGGLDICGVVHSLSGVAIITLSKSFMVENACSGIHSLFSCTCVMAVVCVVQHYGPVRVILNLVQTIGWVIAANALRVFLVVYSYTEWGIDLDAGLRHDLLGATTYGLALLFSLSTDRLLHFLAPANSHSTIARVKDFEPSNPDNWRKQIRLYLDKPRMQQARTEMLAVAILFLMLSPLAVARMTNPNKDKAAGPQPDEAFAQKLNLTSNLQDVLPDVVAPWGRSKLINTDEPKVAAYDGMGLSATFRVRSPFNSWFDPVPEFEAAGWKQNRARSFQSPQAIHTTSFSVYKDDGIYGTIVSSCFDSRLMSIPPLERSVNTNRILGRLGVASEAKPIIPPVFQLQLFCETHERLLAEETQSLERLHDQLCNSFLQALQEDSGE